jgi:hypothetical protein
MVRAYRLFLGLVNPDTVSLTTITLDSTHTLQGFGAEMEMKMYMGDDEGDVEHIGERSPGGIVIETLSNIRTVASLTLEEKQAAEYLQALVDEDPRPIRTNVVKGM